TFLISNAIDDLALHISADAPAIMGQALASVIDDYKVSQKSLQRLTQRYPATLLDGLLEVEPFKADQSHDRPYVEQWAEQLGQVIAKLQPSLRPEVSLE
ncbi:hypothetical protein, partial [Escherichia coli]